MSPDLDTVFHLVFAAEFLAFAVIRRYWFGRSAPARVGARLLEPRWAIGLRAVLAVPALVLIASYLVRPGSLAFAGAALPAAVRAGGAVLGLVGLGLLWWVQNTLGDNFHGILHVRRDHSLVTDGPYRRVRHPMYTTFYVFGLAFFLLTGNLVLTALWTVPLTLILIARTGREEAAMLAEFGPAYADYMARTGRFVPRLGLGAGAR